MSRWCYEVAKRNHRNHADTPSMLRCALEGREKGTNATQPSNASRAPFGARWSWAAMSWNPVVAPPATFWRASGSGGCHPTHPIGDHENLLLTTAFGSPDFCPAGIISRQPQGP